MDGVLAELRKLYVRDERCHKFVVGVFVMTVGCKKIVLGLNEIKTRRSKIVFCALVWSYGGWSLAACWLASRTMLMKRQHGRCLFSWADTIWDFGRQIDTAFQSFGADFWIGFTCLTCD